MKKNYARHLITSALPYANGPLHIGHLAGCYLPADVYVRYLRACKKDVLFIGGSDEHGVPILIRAMKENTTPQAVVDHYHERIKSTFKQMGISFDIYSRTSAPEHYKTSQDFFSELYKKGIFEEHTSAQFYDEEKKMFLADRYVVGTCPHCGNEGAYGDQCERCGSTLSADELINPRSALTGAVPIKKDTLHWYFPLEKFADALEKWIFQTREVAWKSNVLGQCKSWLEAGLRARAMTRDADWGIPVPLENAQGKVLYVWFDAPIGYISATKECTPEWKKYWCEQDTELVHFVGKDNIVFHCIIFPAMLMAHGGFVLPTNVPANEFLNIESDKISTSRNWAVWVEDYLKDFEGMQDVLRYTLLSILPEAKDSDFTWGDFQAKNNNELVAILGNFVNRTFVMAHKLCEGKVPKLHADDLDERDREIQKNIERAKKNVEEKINTFHFREALFSVMELAREANRYLQAKEPWIKARALDSENKAEAVGARAQIDNTIYLCLQTTANLAILLAPFLPDTAHKICTMLKVVPRILEWENAGKLNLLNARYPLREPALLFRKIEDTEIAAQLAKMQGAGVQKKEEEKNELKTDTKHTLKNETCPPLLPTITIDDFAKIDLRIGIIKEASRVPKADKLLQFKVDIGVEERTILSGIAQHFVPEKLIGKRVVVVANLAARKMRGIESAGMLLLVEDEKGSLVFVTSEEDTPAAGAKIT